MSRFLFDTSVLVQYLRGDSTAEDAIAVASEKGRVFVSIISVFELWSPEKWKIQEKSPNFVPIWVNKLDREELPVGIIELLEGLTEHDLDIPIAPNVIKVRNRHWAIADESGLTVANVRLENGTIVIIPPDKKRSDIKGDIDRIKSLFDDYMIQVIGVSKTAQRYASLILEYHYTTLGKNALADALIIASGLARRADLVTRDVTAWNIIARDIQHRFPSMRRMRVVSPRDLVERTVHE